MARARARKTPETPQDAKRRQDRQTTFLKAYSKNLDTSGVKEEAFDAGLKAVFLDGFYAGKGRRA